MTKMTLIPVLAVLALVSALPASAAQVQVSGEQAVIDPDLGIYSMSGSLVGTWYMDSVECHATPFGEGWPCTGAEHFVGCLDASGDGTCAQEQSGRIDFAFEFTGTPVGNGRCRHVITSGIGGFAGASGVLTMKDRPTAAGLVTTYKGHIDL